MTAANHQRWCRAILLAGLLVAQSTAGVLHVHTEASSPRAAQISRSACQSHGGHCGVYAESRRAAHPVVPPMAHPVGDLTRGPNRESSAPGTEPGCPESGQGCQLCFTAGQAALGMPEFALEGVVALAGECPIREVLVPRIDYVACYHGRAPPCA